MEERQVGIAFSGGAFASLGYSLLLLLLAVFVIPAAWGTAAFMVWWTGCLAFSDGTRAVFEGRAGRVWGLFAALIVLACLPSVVTAGMPPGNKALAVNLTLALVLLPLEAALKLPIYRWLIEGIRLEPGGNPRFVGTYAGYLGWVFFLVVSVVTIIGWAWVAVAMVRWFCRHIESDAYSVSFVGTGWGMLWRSFLWLVGMVCIIPLPWVFRSMYAWGVNNLVLTHTAQAADGDDFPVAGTA